MQDDATTIKRMLWWISIMAAVTLLQLAIITGILYTNLNKLEALNQILLKEQQEMRDDHAR